MRLQDKVAIVTDGRPLLVARRAKTIGIARVGLALVLAAMLAAVLVIVRCSTAQAPINPPLAHYDPHYGFRLENVAVHPENSRALLLVLMFSGGGTRAASLAYGALEALRDTPVSVPGRQHSLLTEVDYISATSGGAVTAAYYALFRDRIFTDFPDKFLYRNVQGELIDDLLLNLHTLTSPRYGRGDLFADYLDRTLYEGKTFGDLAQQPRPFIALNATDISLGGQFVFSQHHFDLICSDLSAVKVARAVASSAAAPPVFSPLTFWNYAGKCGYTLPPFLTDPIKDSSLRRQRDRADILSYLDAENRPYLHLFDGGLIDNLGVRQAMSVVLRRGSIAATLEAMGYADVDYVAFISVDAEREPTFDLDHSADVPGPIKSMTAMTNVVGYYSFEASARVRETMKTWEQQLSALRGPGVPPPQFFLIDVSLHAIADPVTRRRVSSIPTTLHLTRPQVDELRALAGTLLRDSPDFKQLMTIINSPANPGSPPAAPR